MYVCFVASFTFNLFIMSKNTFDGHLIDFIRPYDKSIVSALRFITDL